MISRRSLEEAASHSWIYLLSVGADALDEVRLGLIQSLHQLVEGRLHTNKNHNAVQRAFCNSPALPPGGGTDLELSADAGRLLLLVQVQQGLGDAVVKRHAAQVAQRLHVQQVLLGANR